MFRFPNQRGGVSPVAPNRTRAMLGVEALENRLVPTVVVDPVSRVMTINPDSYVNLFTPSGNFKGTYTSVTGNPTGGVEVAEGSSYDTRHYSDIRAIEINGGPGGDFIWVDSLPAGMPLKISANGGNDWITVNGSRSPIDVYTGSGDDKVDVWGCSAQLGIVNTGDRDKVKVGYNGSMSGIAAPVSVSNDACSPMPSSTELELDNRYGSRPSRGPGQYGDVRIGSGEVAGLSYGSIFYGGNTALSVWTSYDQRNAFVSDTGGSGVTVNLARDHSGQTVFVGGTTSPLRINDYGGNTISFGAIQGNGIRGAVSIYGYSWYSPTDLEFRDGYPTSGLVTWSGYVRVISYYR